VVVSIALSGAWPAGADEIRAGGDTLHGSVAAVSADGVEFKPDYGSGSIVVPLDKIEAIDASQEFYFVHGTDAHGTRGRLLAVRDGRLLVGATESEATEIDPATLHQVYDAEAMDGASGWLRRATALWHGSFDFGFGATQSTIDTLSLATGFVADRKKRPSRVTFSAGYRYGTKKEKGEEETTDENEIKGMLRGEYDLMPKLFGFASQDAEYDEIEDLSIRAVPKAGLGYRLWDSKEGLFQLEAGGAYVYEKFFGGDDNGYFGIAFGKLLEWKLPWLGTEFHWRTDYLPAVDDFTGDYLIRTEAALLVPMVSWLKLKIGVEDDYDSTPAEDTDHNTLVTSIGLAATY
jgi:hypothetical protein